MLMRRILGLVAVAVVTSSAFGLTDEEVFRNFRFNLINPGARSLAMGGAFISLADDATAAQANPAGLSYLRRPEFFAEYRYVDNASRASILRETLPPDIDTFVATGTDLADRNSPTFISLVSQLGTNWIIGVSRQEVLNTRNSTVSSFAFSFPSPPSVFVVQGSGSIDVKATNYNASAGFRVNDRFALGGSLAYSTLSVRSEVTNFIVDTGGTVAGRQILEPTLDLRTSIHDNDTDYAFNLGAIYTFQAQNLTFAAVYRRAPKFSVRERIDPVGPDIDDDGFPDSGIDTQDTRKIVRCAPATPCAFGNTFHLPDSYGVSESWSGRKLTISQDFERVEYTDLLEGYVPGINILTGADARFTVKDAWEYHFGAEYVLKARAPIALRAGLFTEHDSTIRAASTGANAFATPASFPGRRRDTEIHVTGGAGIVWGGEGRYKLDGAIDRAGSDNEYLVSFIFRGK